MHRRSHSLRLEDVAHWEKSPVYSRLAWIPSCCRTVSRVVTVNFPKTSWYWDGVNLAQATLSGQL